MIINATICGSGYLGLIVNVFNPSTGLADTVTGAQATFYRLDSSSSSGFAAVSLPAPIDLAQIGSVAGLWGAIVDIAGINVTGLAVVVTATVGADTMSDLKILSGSGSGPNIVVTAGPQVTEAKG